MRSTRRENARIKREVRQKEVRDRRIKKTRYKSGHESKEEMKGRRKF
jgi:hypothetical protein